MSYASGVEPRISTSLQSEVLSGLWMECLGLGRGYTVSHEGKQVECAARSECQN
jgi:hypothetical protein